jgi:hypothetical protein
MWKVLIVCSGLVVSALLAGEGAGLWSVLPISVAVASVIEPSPLEKELAWPLGLTSFGILVTVIMFQEEAGFWTVLPIAFSAFYAIRTWQIWTAHERLELQLEEIEKRFAFEQAQCGPEYHEALERLRRDPTNPDLRQQALEKGRRCKELLKYLPQRYTEAALRNDIEAACAGATAARGQSAESTADEIEKLGKLFLRGVITAEEFERGKAMFLGSPPDKAAAAVELVNNLHQLMQSGALSESEFKMKKWDILSERLIPR